MFLLLSTARELVIITIDMYFCWPILYFKSIGNLCRISWRSHSLKKWVQMMMISPVYILCISGNTAILRKVVRQSARGNPKRYCGLFWVHCFSKKFERMVGEAVDICLRVLKVGNKSRCDSYSVRNSVLILSHITFRDCRVHIFSDNLSRNSCILKQCDNWAQF